MCGRILCCFNHQREHELTEHKEFDYLLDKLPIMCKKCCRNIYSVRDLHTSCHPFMDHRLMNGKFSKVIVCFNKPYRKRSLNQTEISRDRTQPIIFSNKERKKLVPVYKFKRVDIRSLISNVERSQQMLIIEVNHIHYDSKPSVFSPQSNNMSYKMLVNNIVESSTPLNEEEKENSLSNENLKKNQSDCESPEIFYSPVIVISAKKNTPPGIISNLPKRISKKVLKNRRVTFEFVKTNESESNFTVYGTPTADMEILDEVNDGTETHLTIPSSPPRCLLFEIVKKMKNVMNSIPQTIFTAWDWSNQKFKKSQSNDDHEIRSPSRKRPKYNTGNSLVRKPITSYWVNMSVNSLIREPLPNYIHKFYNSEEISH